jgi:hypothetical protein
MIVLVPLLGIIVLLVFLAQEGKEDLVSDPTPS